MLKIFNLFKYSDIIIYEYPKTLGYLIPKSAVEIKRH